MVRRWRIHVVFVWLLVAWLSPMRVSAQSQVVVNGRLPPEGLTVAAGETLAVSVSGGPGSATDWIGFYATDAPEGAYSDWRYLNGATVPPAAGLTDATVRFTMPVAPGTYEFRFYANNSYVRLATSTTMTVEASLARLTLNGIDPPPAASVGAGTSMTLAVTGGPGNPADWVGLYAVASADGAFLTRRYLNGSTSPPASGTATATLTLQAPTSPGSYEFRLFANDSFERLAASTTLVVSASTAQLAVNGVAPPTAITVGAGSVAVVSVSGGPANAGDWVGLYAAGALSSSYLDWRYLSNTTIEPAIGMAAATLIFTMPVTAGSYEFRLFASNGYDPLAASSAVTIPVPMGQIVVNGTAAPTPVAVSAGSVITAQISGGPANAADWLGLYASGASNGTSLTWFYLNGLRTAPSQGVSTASVTFIAPTIPGSYEVRLFSNNTQQRLATSSTITIAASPAGIVVNGIAPPAQLIVVPAVTATVQITGGPGNPRDWVALAPAGAASPNYLAWQYLNGLGIPPGSGLTDAALTFMLPAMPGSYELRLFANDSFDRLATSSTVVVQVATSPCNIAFSRSVVTTSWTARSDGFMLTGPSDCTWSAQTPDWIALTQAAGQGNATVGYILGINTTGVARTGSIVIGDASMTITQAGAPCALTVSPTSLTAAAAGASGTIAASTLWGCVQPGTSNVPWIHVPATAGYVGGILGDGPTGYWRLGELAGTTAADSSGHGLGGSYGGTYTLGAPASFADGNTAVTFTGGYAYVGSSSNVNPTGSFSLEAWVRLTDPTTGAVAGSWAYGAGYQLEINGTTIRFRADDVDPIFVVDSVRTVNDGLWHHVVGVFDANASEARLFVDGALDGIASAWEVPFAGGDFIMGASDYGADSFIAASIDEVAFYTSALTGDQIAQHFAAQHEPLTGTGTVDYAMPDTVDQNLFGVARTGTIAIGDQTIVVGQSGVACSVSEMPASIAAPAIMTSGQIAVTAAPGCPWLSSTNVPWVTLSNVLGGYPGQVIADGAQGFWRLNELTGTTAADASGHGLDGMYHGTYTPGVAGAMAGDPAVGFSAGSGWVLVPGIPVSGPDAPISLEAWVQYTGGSFGRVVSQGVYALEASGTSATFRGLASERNFFQVRGVRRLNDGLWHHLVGVSNPASQTAQLFVDGVLDRGTSFSTIFNATGDLAIGIQATGNIDEVAIYPFALSANQIANHFLQRGSAGGGNGQLTFTVAANPTIAPRVGLVTIADLSIPVTQVGATCISADPGTVNLTSTGGVGTIQVNALDGGCTWTAVVDASWLTVDAASGTGSGQLHYTAAANTTMLTRTASVTVASQTVSFTENGVPPQRPALGFSIATGGRHTLALKADGTVWSWGANEFGQLGDGTTRIHSIAVPISSLANIVAVAAGDSHSLALTSDGTVWAWGNNGFGELGDGSGTTQATPVRVVGLTDIVAIAAGNEHSVALAADGTVWTWGLNNFGQLGDGSSANRYVPVLVSLAQPAFAIAAATLHTMVLTADGSVWGFGQNASGTIGDGTQVDEASPTAAAPVPSLVGSVGAASSDSFGLGLDGTVWAWGANSFGQIGDTTTTARLQPGPLSTIASIQQIQGGTSHTVALRLDGTVWTWGANDAGQIGNGTAHCGPSDWACPARQYVATPFGVPGLANMVAISASGGSSFAVSADGHVWAWGDNSSNQLGDGTHTDGLTPVPIAGANFAWLTGTPLLGPSGGTYPDVVFVTSGSATPGAVIHYTTNGDAPTESDPILTGMNVEVTQTTTITARAWSDGQPPSNTSSVTYTLMVPVPTFNPVGGAYTSPQNVTIASPIAQTTIFYTTDGSDPTTISNTYMSPIPVISGTTVKAIAIRSGWTNSAAGSSTYAFDFGTLVVPTIAPASGSYVYGQSIAISADSIATIHYTTDGSLPTLVSLTYTGPLTVNGSVTVTAQAFNPDWTPSVTARATYTAKAAPPTLSPTSGTYAADQRITITDATPGTTVRYTNNGQDPTVNDLIIANGGSIALGNFTVKARAFRAGLTPSDIASASYSRTGDSCGYTVTPPVVSVGPSPNGGVVTISATNASCSWTASAEESWMTVNPASGTGTAGQVAYHVSANPTSDLRSGVITIGGENVLVVQAGQASCTFNVAPGAVASTADASSGQLAVTTNDSSCTWAATSTVPWMSIATNSATSAYAQAVLADHPVGYWRLNEPSGTIVGDTSGLGHAGSYNGAVTLGLAGSLADGSTVATFDGATGFVAIPQDAAFNVTALTWEAWVNVPAASTAWRKILGKGTASEVFSLWVGPNMNQPTVYIGFAGAGRQAITLNAAVVGVGWAHVAFTYDGTTWQAYVNGIEDQSGVVTDTLVTNASEILFGRDDTPVSAWYDGQLGEVALYPYALGADQIANHFAQRTATSNGSGQVTYTIGANTSGAVRTGTLTVAGTLVPVSQAATGGVTTAGSVSPSPNAAGWNNTNVVVSFVCAGTGTITCPGPVAVTQEGMQAVTGTASDTDGHVATTTVTVQIDKTAPLLTIASPMRGAIVATGPVTVTGMVADLLSGVTTVTCDGAAAMVLDGSFSCAPIVSAATATITVEATDAALNVRTAAVAVTTTAAVTATPPTSLRITPQNITMLSGETHGFSVMDDQGRSPLDAQWAVDNVTLATLTTDTGVRLTAISSGAVTLTVTWWGLTATTHVTILGVAGAPVGTTLWSVPSVAGSVNTIVQGAIGSGGTHNTYVVDGPQSGPDVIRAFDTDGAELWTALVGGRVTQLSGDQAGGAAALLDDGSIRAYSSTGRSQEVGQAVSGGFAIHPGGPLYYVSADSRSLIGADLGSGGGGPAVAFPDDASPGIPTVLGDGSVAVPFATYPIGTQEVALHVLFLRPDGSTVVEDVPDPTLSVSWGAVPYKAVPNGQGGVIVMWDRFPSQLGTNWPSTEARVSALAADGTYLGGINLVVLGVEQNGLQRGSWWSAQEGRFGDLVLGDQGWLVATTYSSGYGSGGPVPDRLNVVTPIASNGDSGSFSELVDTEASSVVAGAAGAFVMSLSDGSVSGPDPAFPQMHLTNAQYVASLTWLGVSDGALTAMTGPRFLRNGTGWSEDRGLHAANAASTVCADVDEITAWSRADLSSLVSEYPVIRVLNTAGKPVTITASCDDFSQSGSGSVYFLWEELAGHVIFDYYGNRRPSDNDHGWAIVKDSVRTGIDKVYEYVGGIRLDAAYRSPNINASLKPTPGAINSSHIYGVGVDMKPVGAPPGSMLKDDWTAFEQVVKTIGGALWTERPYEKSKDHVHGSFEWWPGRPEFRAPQ